jgi:hypothetical protein
MTDPWIGVAAGAPFLLIGYGVSCRLGTIVPGQAARNVAVSWAFGTGVTMIVLVSLVACGVRASRLTMCGPVFLMATLALVDRMVSRLGGRADRTYRTPPPAATPRSWDSSRP